MFIGDKMLQTSGVTQESILGLLLCILYYLALNHVDTQLYYSFMCSDLANATRVINRLKLLSKSFAIIFEIDYQKSIIQNTVHQRICNDVLAYKEHVKSLSLIID